MYQVVIEEVDQKVFKFIYFCDTNSNNLFISKVHEFQEDIVEKNHISVLIYLDHLHHHDHLHHNSHREVVEVVEDDVVEVVEEVVLQMIIDMIQHHIIIQGQKGGIGIGIEMVVEHKLVQKEKEHHPQQNQYLH